MAAKKTNELIIDAYTSYILKEGEAPKSMHAFAQLNHWKEQDIYAHYSSFASIESEVFFQFFEQTDTLLKKDKSFKEFDAQNKLLSFYYTFFEVLTANRSLVISMLGNHENKIESLKRLGKVRSHFKVFIRTLDIDMISLPHEKLELLKENGLEEAAWAQLLLTFTFWLDDCSPNFEKTDIYIEKAVRAGFDIIQISPLQSVVDLGKFLFKEKMNK